MMHKLRHTKTFCHLDGIVCATIIYDEDFHPVDAFYLLGDCSQDQRKSRLFIEARDHNDEFHIVKAIS